MALDNSRTSASLLSPLSQKKKKQSLIFAAFLHSERRKCVMISWLCSSAWSATALSVSAEGTASW